jgi:hypothetical protein
MSVRYCKAPTTLPKEVASSGDNGSPSKRNNFLGSTHDLAVLHTSSVENILGVLFLAENNTNSGRLDLDAQKIMKWAEIFECKISSKII